LRQALHITSGDSVGGSLEKSGLAGDVFVWHDVLYEGPRKPGWPDEETLRGRALFLEAETGGALRHEKIVVTLRRQYDRLAAAAEYDRVVLWFDACLFDQSMLVHVLTCLRLRGIDRVDLLCVDAFPGIEPFDGLGQLTPGQLASLYENRRPVTEEQFDFAAVADRAFALQDRAALTDLSRLESAALPRVPAAAERRLLEFPDPRTGLGRLEELALGAVRSGCRTPGEIFLAVSAHDRHPLFWGDTTLWARINGLAERTPPLVRIEGPAPRLPQWEGEAVIADFRITAMPDGRT
jgi:hypothetical protein